LFILFIVFWQKQHSVAHYAKGSTESGLEAKRLSTLGQVYTIWTPRKIYESKL